MSHWRVARDVTYLHVARPPRSLAGAGGCSGWGKVNATTGLIASGLGREVRRRKCHAWHGRARANYKKAVRVRRACPVLCRRHKDGAKRLLGANFPSSSPPDPSSASVRVSGPPTLACIAWCE